jgi:hypothetical protein
VQDLASYSVLIIDEAHERTLHTDVLFGLVKVQPWPLPCPPDSIHTPWATEADRAREKGGVRMNDLDRVRGGERAIIYVAQSLTHTLMHLLSVSYRRVHLSPQ